MYAKRHPPKRKLEKAEIGARHLDVRYVCQERTSARIVVIQLLTYDASSALFCGLDWQIELEQRPVLAVR
jgi:hypothetical protein